MSRIETSESESALLIFRTAARFRFEILENATMSRARLTDPFRSAPQLRSFSRSLNDRRRFIKLASRYLRISFSKTHT